MYFEVLNPQSITVDVENKQLNFPANDHVNHRRLASRFKINSPNLAVQTHNLYENVAVDVGHETFKQWTKLPAEVFFYKVLEKQAGNNLIELSSELLKYISSALTVPVGSADAERGFSILFHTLDKRRSTMKIETLSALLTLRINGPELKDFDCHKYLTDWKARGGLESDAQQTRGPGKKQDEDEIEEDTDDPIQKKLHQNEYGKEMWDKRYSIFLKKPFEGLYM